MPAVEAPLQTTWLLGCTTSAIGFTVIVNDFGKPTQDTPPLVYVGITVIVATVGANPVFTAVNEGIEPVPLATFKPMAVLLLVQE